MSRRLDRLVEATPAGRDRAVDFLRALAIGVVVVWHWALSVTHRTDSRLVMPNPIDDVPLGWLATWHAHAVAVELEHPRVETPMTSSEKAHALPGGRLAAGSGLQGTYPGEALPVPVLLFDGRYRCRAGDRRGHRRERP